MIPNPYMILGAVIIVIAAFGSGYYKGYQVYVGFKSDVAAAGKAQELINQQKVEMHNVITEGVKNEYETRIAALRNYYSKRVQYVNPSNVSSLPNTTPGANGSTSDPEFVGRCAATTAQLVSLQEWIRKIK